MNVFRPFAALVALAWCAVLAASLWFVWNPGSVASIDSRYLTFDFGLFLKTGTSQAIASVALGSSIAVGLLAFAAALMPWRGRPLVRDRVYPERGTGAAPATSGEVVPEARYRALEARLDDMNRRLEASQRELADRPAVARETMARQRRWNLLQR